MNHNHDLEVLHSSAHGFLVYCKDCGYFQLGFGTFRLTQSRDEIDGFARVINRYAFCHRRRITQKRRDIYIDTPYPGVGLLLAPAEVEKLNDILQKSLLILDSRDEVRLQ